MIKKIIIALFIVSTLTFCTKRTESKIVGVWAIEHVGQPTFYPNATWTFLSGGELNVYNDINGRPNGTSYGYWEAFSRSGFVPYIEIKGTGPKSLDGKWRIEELKDKTLVMTRVEFGTGETAGSFLRREFTKK